MRPAGWRPIVAALALALVGCSSQPIEAQLATACNQIATAYRTAAILRANGRLGPEAMAALVSAEPLAVSACDPSSPPANLQAALNNATAALNALALANAGVK